MKPKAKRGLVPEIAAKPQMPLPAAAKVGCSATAAMGAKAADGSEGVGEGRSLNCRPGEHGRPKKPERGLQSVTPRVIESNFM